MSMIERLLKLPRPIAVLLFLDIVLILLHLLTGQSNWWFHLDYEWNLPTYYQSLKLFLVGGVAIFVLLTKITAESKSEAPALIFFPLALALIFLGIDEFLQFHEYIESHSWAIAPDLTQQLLSIMSAFGYRSSTWLIYYLPLLLAGFFYGWYLVRYFSHHLDLMKLLLVGGLCFGLVLMCEYLSSRGLDSHTEYFVLVTIEEAAEMIGSTLFAWLLWQVVHPEIKKRKVK